MSGKSRWHAPNIINASPAAGSSYLKGHGFHGVYSSENESIFRAFAGVPMSFLAAFFEPYSCHFVLVQVGRLDESHTPYSVRRLLWEGRLLPMTRPVRSASSSPPLSCRRY